MTVISSSSNRDLETDSTPEPASGHRRARHKEEPQPSTSFQANPAPATPAASTAIQDPATPAIPVQAEPAFTSSPLSITQASQTSSPPASPAARVTSTSSVLTLRSPSPLPTTYPDAWDELFQVHDASMARSAGGPSPPTNLATPPALDTPAGPAPLQAGTGDLTSSVTRNPSPVRIQTGDNAHSPDLWQRRFRTLQQQYQVLAQKALYWVQEQANPASDPLTTRSITQIACRLPLSFSWPPEADPALPTTQLAAALVPYYTQLAFGSQEFHFL